ncbi:Frag1/DRAM/Sfk1 family-domain-containing protein [Lipomyces oligophaga]|uniref:Frag1/DRAM/Sfk1 family-domain-containing protein n=1 Tax=Lipomyces oligophaga TaxID=45792 RepID=UPI0034CD86CA
MSAVAEKRTRPGTVVASASGKWVSYSHTVFAGYAFLSALVLGMLLHFQKIVRNEYYGYPDEWFPSVSATIGDRYPERSVFQIFIAVTAGPRFALLFLTYLLFNKPGSNFPRIHAAIGFIRTITCGGWVYITSTDDHDWHDIFMISYIVLTIPWDIGGVFLSPPDSKSRRYRKIVASTFFFMMIPLVYFFIQHKVHHIAGAYTIYAFFEWSLIFLDVAYDSISALDFASLEIRIVDMTGITHGFPNVATKKPDIWTTAHSRDADKGLLTGFSFSETLLFGAEVYNAFVFWSVWTALGLLIWYFPLWYMGISGYEVTLLSVVSPVFLGIPFLAALFGQFPQIAVLGQLLGVAAYLVLGPSDRLLTVSAGSIFASISLAIQFWNVTVLPYAGLRKATILSFGLVASSIAKFAFYANNPIWPIMHEENGGWNKTGLALGIICAFFTTRPQRGSNNFLPSKTRGSSFIFSAFGVGGLIFNLQSLLSDSSTIIYWTWNGYPVQGPLPVPFGAVTIIAMILGIYLAVVRGKTVASWRSYAIAAVSASILYSFGGWLGYLGGLVLTVYLLAIAPTILDAASVHGVARTFGLGMFVYVLLVLGHVWVVAYAFVPGGPLLRERTDIILGVAMVSIAGGVYAASKLPSGRKNYASVKGKVFIPYFKIRSMTIVYGTLFAALAATIGWRRFDRPAPKPYHAEDNLLTVGIWTIHFGLDNDMWGSEGRMVDAIRDLEIDVIGLLESDTQRIIMGNRDVTQEIAEELGMYVDYGPGPNKHTWGAALLSKFPILNSTHHLLPSPVGELAPAIHATLDVYGKLIDIVVFHSGQEEDVEDRRLQTAGVSEIMAGSSNPTILLSYLVTKPLQGNYNTYVSEHTGMKDIDPSDSDRWCEYILYKDIKRVAYARISRGTITDTEIQTGKFIVGVDGLGESTNNRVDEEQVPAAWRYPAMFRGEGVRGHRFHVFDEPRYYA